MRDLIEQFKQCLEDFARLAFAVVVPVSEL